jgi:hypothetical protein
MKGTNAAGQTVSLVVEDSAKASIESRNDSEPDAVHSAYVVPDSVIGFYHPPYEEQLLWSQIEKDYSHAYNSRAIVSQDGRSGATDVNTGKCTTSLDLRPTNILQQRQTTTRPSHIHVLSCAVRGSRHNPVPIVTPSPIREKGTIYARLAQRHTPGRTT